MLIVVCGTRARVAVEVVREVVQWMASTGRVPVLSAKVLVVPAVEATLTVPSLWDQSLWPGLPAVAVVEIVKARVAAELARPFVQLTGKVPAFLAKVLGEPAGEAALV